MDNRVKGVQGGFTVNTSVNGGQCIKGLSEVGQIGHDQGTYGFRWNHMAVAEKLARLDRSRLARECAKLLPGEEQQLADEGMGRDASEWPEY